MVVLTVDRLPHPRLPVPAGLKALFVPGMAIEDLEFLPEKARQGVPNVLANGFDLTRPQTLVHQDEDMRALGQ